MSGWSLEVLLGTLHDDIANRLIQARKSFGHPVVKGDASEGIWRELLGKYLPQRYAVASAHVVDSKGAFSEQLDVVVFDRQYSPFVLNYEGQQVLPAESVYAAFEAKQTINAAQIEYAHKKLASVRALHRTSLPIPTANGLANPKPPQPILGGLLTLDSDWSPPLGEPFLEALAKGGEGVLDLGCCAAHGAFFLKADKTVEVNVGKKAATAFLLELIAQLQGLATVPMMDVRAYAAWLAK